MNCLALIHLSNVHVFSHFTQGFRDAEQSQSPCEVWMLSGPGQWACNDNSSVQDLDTNWGLLSCVTALTTAVRHLPKVLRTPGLLIDLDLGIGLFDCPDKCIRYVEQSNLRVCRVHCSLLLVTAALQSLVRSWLQAWVTILSARAGSLPRLSFNKRVSCSAANFTSSF